MINICTQTGGLVTEQMKHEIIIRSSPLTARGSFNVRDHKSFINQNAVFVRRESPDEATEVEREFNIH